VKPRWLLEAPEALCVCVGAALRLGGRDYAPLWGYDFHQHWYYVDYLTKHHAIPPPSYGTAAYHPPLYYWIAAWLSTPGAAQMFSIVAGIARLILLWVGLRIVLPENRLARTLALALAAVLPCSIQLDIMVTNEALNALLGTAALVVLVLMLRRKRLGWGIAEGAIIGAMLLTKVSGLIPLGLCGLAAAVPLLRRQGLRAAAAPLCAVALGAAIGMPFHLWRRSQTGEVIVSSPYQVVPEGIAYARSFDSVPYWRRRPLTYAFGLGHGEIFRQIPCQPADADRFLPVLLATTFGDYYNQWFSGLVDPATPSLTVNDRPMPQSTIKLLRASIYAGAVIAIAILCAWIAAARRALRERNEELGLLLLAPALATLGQLHYAIKYPFIHAGMIKAHYIQFVAAPLFGLFGVAVAWLWSRPRTRAAAIALCAATAVVAVYSIDARTGWFR